MGVKETKVRKITAKEQSEAWIESTTLLKEYKLKESKLNETVEKAGFSKLGNISKRVKSDQSLHDKIINYLKDNEKSKINEALYDIRDPYGIRTIVLNQDLTHNPEVENLLNSGKEREAILKAAEIQSEPAIELIKNIIKSQANNTGELKIIRISNYVSDDGIPYVSENQLQQLKDFSEKENNIKFDFNKKLSKEQLIEMKIDPKKYKPTTKSQPSGYTAFQMNFVDNEGHIMEWQYRGEEVNKFAEGEHIPYDLRTNKDIIGMHPELKLLYDPIKKVLDECIMPKNIYKQYQKYLTDYYTYLRKIELGFTSGKPPELSDYEIEGYKFDSRLDGKYLIAVHNLAEQLKNGEITQAKAGINNLFILKGFNPFKAFVESRKEMKK